MTVPKGRGQVSRLFLYADSFRLPKEISHPLIKKMISISQHSGPEYACEYMKAIKLDFIRIKAGLSPCSKWVSRNGPYKGIITWSKGNHKRWSRAICLLQAYTTFYSKTVTPKQERKFLDGVQSENIEISPSLKNGISLVGSILFEKSFIRNPRPHILNFPNKSKRAPHPNGKTYPEELVHLESINYVLKTHFGDSIRRKYSKMWNSVMEGISIIKYILPSGNFVKIGDEWVNDQYYRDSVGKIGLIQEPGYKLRAVANPARIYQSLLKPLGDDLYDKLKSLPWDCTHNQSKADLSIIQHLSKGNEIFSVDLSGATDYFPLDLQILLLKSMYYNHDSIDMFYDISRGDWFYKDKKIRWTKGQPLGLYPSFASFALTHGCLLFLLNGLTHDNKFFVLGDDVVILDPTLYSRYISTLETLQCPISESKTLRSRIIAEFAGKIITSQGSFPQLKWRNPSDDNFVDLVKNIGLSILPILKTNQKKIINILKDIPDFLGGLGFNPNGLPLIDRIAKAYEIMKDKQGGKYLMDFDRILSEMIYYDSSKIPTFDQFSIDQMDFDKKSKGLVERLLPLYVFHYKVLGQNLYDIDCNQHHPLESGLSRRSRLDSLMYLIQ